VWTQPTLRFATQPQTIPAGARSELMTLALTTSTGLAVTARAPLAVTLSSSSPGGMFATSPAGPWSTSLSLVIAAGTETSADFYYLDTHGGIQTLTALAEGVTDGTQTVTITAGPPVALTVTPASATIRARATRRFAAAGSDSFGNRFPVSATWSLTPPTIGTIALTMGSTTTFKARGTPGEGTLTAALTTEAGTITSVATVRVRPGR
jgi:hypothetical protein